MKLGGYHIIFVPQDASQTKRFHLSKVTARLVAFVLFLIVPLLLIALFSALHYQNEVAALNQNIAEEHQIIAQKELLMSRVSRLERSLSHTEESLHKLESALDLELGQIKTGLGPVEKEALFKKKVQELPKVNSVFDNLVAMEEPDEEITLRDLQDHLDGLSEKIAGLQSNIDEVYNLHEDKIRFLDATPQKLPVNGWITSDFGFRRSPYSGRYKMHYGLDIAAPLGTEVRVPASGRVLVADYQGGYGRKVVIDHGYGVTTVYGHAAQLFVKDGEMVKKGQVIASVGSSGASTGPHVHYEIHVDGLPIDPFLFLSK
ncbi:MAG: hypothetical protein A3G32_07980 [Deltaproteobacteria bacterium RIFCSPLOWO2_12_FULL_40_28]|nr:MAG: hypothetical protein A3C45_00680 [Deltaproteobacteria bacterium RIFCSPHIGHO2_02_FULL_40_28]OGQ20850.1 MAG: hypothetical protein A3E27_03345 [Deltaproteobacteria bacterium RIFCSPHIGHO2_12_FULL_40_32]OGQ39251.1 MAG: hypothetical protein A3I69_04705 [Deltaproteobacteria bacterium RIFCSPLOWO2_02_FULL_40_36]OGQ54532.1 MAG: hypothetical protein A3G32_07980 [Deltaproteobacteria bacterium RIFCSPLOWO2_12_FULL_40_28]